MNYRSIHSWALTAALVLATVTAGVAQDYRGRVQGIVTDQSKAVIAGASVTLLNVNTGVKVVRLTSDTGLYLFDLVDPGTYSLTVSASGFEKYVQQNFTVQTRGDVTVNATLTPGAVQQSITVTEAPAAVEFNSSNKDLTIDTKMAEEIPRIDRNPFKLTLIAPSAVNTRGEMMPYHSWAANSVDLGGGTNLKNDLEVDGSPIGLGHKNSYPPNTDAVQEVVVSQNSVDAESGHSAGGLISITTKSGTNEWHGTGFYLGRYPWLNAVADRTRFSENAQRQNMFGGTLGNPIIKNKLFNFFSIEDWKVGQPNSYVNTMPTALEQQGDFSQSYNINGGVRTIYDPFSTQFDPATGAVTRLPFAGNRVPSSRFDPLSAQLMKQLWAPNGPGDNITGVNNYKKGFTETFNYYNFSERADYNISDKWKAYGRVSRYHTTDISADPTPNHSALYQPTGSLRAADQVAGDVIWTATPTTVVNFHGDWHKVIDAYVSQDLGSNGWSKIWPNNNWYKPYQDASIGVPVYYPGVHVGGASFGGPGFFWNQQPQGEAFDVKASQQRGSHYLKVGLEHRRSYGLTYVSSTSNFNFGPALTADTFNNPNTKLVGDEWATFLLGGLDGSSQMIGGPSPDPHTEFWGMYFQDDWKVNNRVTINMGLRNEYESAYHDPLHDFSQGLDLSQPVPEMQAAPPQMPQQALSIVGNNFYKWNGMWQWTSGSHPGMWDPQRFALQPRLGIALRINDKTSLRAGYARYLTPSEYNVDLAPVPGFETVGFLEPPFFGMTGYQNTAPLLQGVPQQTFSNPYPSSNPLLPITGKGYGTNLGRGGQSLLWYPQNFQKPRNDRFDVSFQHELPSQIVASFTFFSNIGNQLYTKSLNHIDPRIQQQYQGQLSQNVPNPFYNYLTPTLFPGPLRNQKTVSLGSLLVPYPQYGGLYQVGTLGAGERYNSLEFKAQKSFSRGYNFLFSYVYIRESTQGFFNDLDQYSNNLTWLPSNQPHHRFNVAGTWELPFGKGRSYLSNMPKPVEAVLGGWQIAALMTYTSGDFPRFGNMIATGSPCVSNPSMQHWFNTSVFQPVPSDQAYTLRTNPLQYGCLNGPNFMNIDATLSKTFQVTEKVKTELKMSAYNATNRLNLGDPNTNIYSSTFGQALYQGSPGGSFGPQGATYGGQSGRQVELGLKIIF